MYTGPENPGILEKYEILKEGSKTWIPRNSSERPRKNYFKSSDFNMNKKIKFSEEIDLIEYLP